MVSDGDCTANDGNCMQLLEREDGMWSVSQVDAVEHFTLKYRSRALLQSIFQLALGFELMT